jgi:hypothetical protein
VLGKLQEAARRDLGDFLTFVVGPDEDHPAIQSPPHSGISAPTT